MRALRLLLAPLVVAGGLATGPAPVGAEAAEPPTVSLDTSTPGTVVVTTTTGPGVAFVSVALRDPSGAWGERATTAVAADTHQATAALASWGFNDTSTVVVSLCSTPNECVTTFEEPVSPLGLDPTVTWPDQQRIGPGNTPFVVTVDDVAGGGHLEARAGDAREALNRSGETTLAFDGAVRTGAIEVWRCGDGWYAPCAPTTVASPPVEVRTTIPFRTDLSTSGVISASPGKAPHTTLSLHHEETGDYSLDWWAVGSDVGASGLQVHLSAGEPLAVPLDLTGLANGDHRIQARLTRDFPGFGVIRASTDDNSPYVSVDSDAPTGRLTVSSPTLYPREDGYQDTVTISTHPVDADSTVVEISDASGTVVRSMPLEFWQYGEVTWNGTRGNGTSVPNGTYSIRATLSDAAGNTTVLAGRQVTVSSKRLVHRTFTRTVTPAQSVVYSQVGKCSTLRRPSARRWKGSFGYYTNTRCRTKDLKKSLAQTQHVLQVPAAARYGSLRITTYGGGARTMPGSYLFLDQFSRAGAWRENDTRLGNRIGSHPGPSSAGSGYVHDDRYIRWAVYTAMGAAYDVKSFTVTLGYDVLV